MNSNKHRLQGITKMKREIVIDDKEPQFYNREMIVDVKKRWKHMRDHYMKKRKVDSGTGQARSSNQWEYMSHLTFLSQAPSHRVNLKAEHSEVTETQETEEDTHDNEENSLSQESEIAVQNYCVLNYVDRDAASATSNVSGEPVTSSLGRKRKISDENSLAIILEKKQEESAPVFAKLLSQQTKSPIHKFFDSMADIVSEFPPYLITEARHKVFEAVHKIEMKMYDEQSTSRAMASNNYTGGCSPCVPKLEYFNNANLP